MSTGKEVGFRRLYGSQGLGGLFSRFGHPEGFFPDGPAFELLESRLRFGRCTHFNEAESTSSIVLGIRDHDRGQNRSGLLKQSPKLLVRKFEGQPADK